MGTRFTVSTAIYHPDTGIPSASPAAAWARSSAPRTRDLARIVAIKVLADRYANDEAIRARFTREALAAARLSNAPSTVTIFDVGEHDDHPYIVMEYLPGGSLADRLARDGAQPMGRSLEWLGQAAAALDAAHASGVVHRDVKPANLLLDNDDRVKVADFGVASAVGLGSLTEVGTVLGTAGYLAPEQARGEKATPASDRYALAVVAFELLTGTRPFERESSTAEAMAHVSAPIPPASSLNPELPSQVDDALARGLAKEPEHRYETAADLVHALRDAARRRRGQAPPSARSPRSQRAEDAAGWFRVIALAPCVFAGVVAAALLPAMTPKERHDRPTTVPRTVKETVTLPATTVVQTVTTEAAPTTRAGDDGSLRQSRGAERPGLRADARRRLRGSAAAARAGRRRAVRERRDSRRPTRATTSRSRASRSAGATASSSCSTARSRSRASARRSARSAARRRRSAARGTTNARRRRVSLRTASRSTPCTRRT